MSGTRWRQIVNGTAGQMSSQRGVRTVARMAQLVGLKPADLIVADREDVAQALHNLLSPRDPAGPITGLESLTLEEALALAEKTSAEVRAYLDSRGVALSTRQARVVATWARRLGEDLRAAEANDEPHAS